MNAAFVDSRGFTELLAGLDRAHANHEVTSRFTGYTKFPPFFFLSLSLFMNSLSEFSTFKARLLVVYPVQLWTLGVVLHVYAKTHIYS